MVRPIPSRLLHHDGPPESHSAGAALIALTPGGIAVLAVLAFVVRVRQETIRHLIKKVVDVTLSPGSDAAASTVALVPTLLDFGAVSQNVSRTLSTQVFNAGADTIHVAEASVSIEPAKNGVVVSAVAAIDLAPGSSLPIEVTWTPVTPQSLDVTLVVSTESRRLTARLRGTLTTGCHWVRARSERTPIASHAPS